MIIPVIKNSNGIWIIETVWRAHGSGEFGNALSLTQHLPALETRRKFCISVKLSFSYIIYTKITEA